MASPSQNDQNVSVSGLGNSVLPQENSVVGGTGAKEPARPKYRNVLPIVIAGMILLALVVFALRLTGSMTSAPLGSAVPEATPSESVDNGEPEGTGTVAPAAPVTEITLTITSPANNTTVSESRVTVRGRTAPKAEVFVNDAETKADGNGDFSATVTLDEGENYILVVANDESGRFSEKELTVTYAP